MFVRMINTDSIPFLNLQYIEIVNSEVEKYRPGMRKHGNFIKKSFARRNIESIEKPCVDLTRFLYNINSE